ncbi:MAG: FecR family protein [Myxococcota bacterium]
MSELRTKMRSPIEETELDEVFHRVEASLQPRPRKTRRFGMGFAIAGAIAMGALGAYALVPGSDDPQVSDAAPGPLRWADGPVFEGLGDAREATLSDRSQISVQPGTELRVVANAAEAFGLALEKGHVEIEVQPQGPRLWSVDAGDARVEVLGTQFSVTRDGDRIAVRVERGLVSVRWRDETELLGPGQQWERPYGDRTAARAPEMEPSNEREETPPDEAHPEGAPSDEATTPRWRTLAARGDYNDAYAAVQRRGFLRSVTAAPDVETLFALADTARLSGHPADAREPLRRIIEHHQNDRRAAVAAFTLGRLELESFGRREESRRWFERALGLGLQGSLREAAQQRLRELAGPAE